MAGFFGLGNFEKAGPGVSKNTYESPVKVFFGVLGRKFWKMMWLNIMHAICCIPSILLIYIPISAMNDILLQYIYAICAYMFISIVGVPFLNTGFVYVLRNFSRENHAWVIADYWSNIKKNLKQSIPLFIIDILVILVAYINISFYSFYKSNTLMFAARTLILTIISVYFMMHYYIYTIMVTFNLKLKYILKNSLIFTLAKLPRNLIITLIIFLISGLSFYLGIHIGLFIGFFFGLVLNSYIATFMTTPVIDLFMLPDEEDTPEVEPIMNDELIIQKDDTDVQEIINNK